MMAGVKSAVLFWSAFVFVMAGFSARAEVVVDNIDGVRSLYKTINPWDLGASETAAQSFSLGEGLSYRLSSVTVPMIFNGGAENTVTVSIWDSRSLPPSANQPGLPAPSQMVALIGSRTFSGNTAFESYENFTDFGDVTLSGRGYWLVVEQSRTDLNTIYWPTVNRHTTFPYKQTGTGGLGYYGHGVPGTDAWYDSDPPSVVGLMAIEGTVVAAVPVCV